MDKHAASCLFLHGSALQSCPCSPSLADMPCHLSAAGKPLTPASSGNLQGKAPHGVRTVGRVHPSVHKNVQCFTLTVSLLLTDAASTSLHLILVKSLLCICSYSLSVMMHFIHPFIYYFKSFSKSPASLTPGRLIHHLFKVENVRVNKIWVRRLRVDRKSVV